MHGSQCVSYIKSAFVPHPFLTSAQFKNKNLSLIFCFLCNSVLQYYNYAQYTIHVGEDIPSDPEFKVNVNKDYITAISANVSWTVPKDTNNIQFRLQISEEGMYV